MKKNIFLFLLSFLLLGCFAAKETRPTMASDPIAYNQSYPYKTGKPYVIKGITYYPLESVDPDYEEIGVASWYGKDFHGNKTANGEKYDMHAMTAAHKTLPMPTYVRVQNLDNGKEVLVRINDRGPFSKGRIIDLSYAAANELGMIHSGTARVKVTVLSQDKHHLRTENKDVSIDKGSFAVQIASFSDKDNAEMLAKKYKNAAVMEGNVNGKSYYRVHVKGYKTRESAEDAAKSFSHEYKGAFVVSE